MASGLVQVEANHLLDSSVKGTAYTAATTPVKLRLVTVIGSATAAGTEVTGGSYTPQDTTTATIWGSASSGSITNSSGAVTFTNMPARHRRRYGAVGQRRHPDPPVVGNLSANKTTNSGDTLSFGHVGHHDHARLTYGGCVWRDRHRHHPLSGEQPGQRAIPVGDRGR